MVMINGYVCVVPVGSCAEELDDYVIEPTDAMLENFSKIDRCLRVLENVSNQTINLTCISKTSAI